MSWPHFILAFYASIAAALWVSLVLEEEHHRNRVSLGGALDALFCALLWPVILGIILLERVGAKRRSKRGGDRP